MGTCSDDKRTAGCCLRGLENLGKVLRSLSVETLLAMSVSRSTLTKVAFPTRPKLQQRPKRFCCLPTPASLGCYVLPMVKAAPSPLHDAVHDVPASSSFTRSARTCQLLRPQPTCSHIPSSPHPGIRSCPRNAHQSSSSADTCRRMSPPITSKPVSTSL